MTNLEKANKEVLILSSEWKWLLKDIKPIIADWIPKLASSKTYWENKESFLYFIEWKRKFFIEVRISTESEYITTHPRFELSSRYDNIVDSYLHKYPPYLSPNKSLTLFIINDLPKLINHNRDKNIYVQCFTDEWQGNIWHFRVEPQLSKLIAEAWLIINYVVQLQ